MVRAQRTEAERLARTTTTPPALDARSRRGLRSIPLWVWGLGLSGAMLLGLPWLLGPYPAGLRVLVAGANGGLWGLSGWYQRRWQRQLQRQTEQALLRSQLLTLLSDECRTPLTTILFSSELIHRYGKNWPAERLTRHAHRMGNSVGRITGILEAVLMFEALATGELGYQPVVLNLPQFLADLTVHWQLGYSDGAVVAYEPSALEQQGEVPSVWADPRLLRTIVINLLTNSVNYSPRGGRVTLQLHYEAGQSQLTITDQGGGIAPADLPRLFEPFVRGQNVGTVPGVGLGLPIARACAALHRGKLVVTSTVGQGTCATVTLTTPPAASPLGDPGGDPGGDLGNNNLSAGDRPPSR